MLPVTGPFHKAMTIKGPPRPAGDGVPMFELSRTWSRQTKPFNLALPLSTTVMSTDFAYFFNEAWPENGINPANNFFVVEAWVELGRGPEVTEASEKAYNKLVGKVSDQSQWANNIIEARKSYDGAMGHIKTLIDFTRKILKRDLVGAGRILKMGVPPGARRKGKSLSGVWLEYHFGWEPLLADIYAGVAALGRDFHTNRLSGSGRAYAFEHSLVTNSAEGLREEDFRNRITAVRQSCAIRIINPNLVLAKDLGLVNPVSVVWETIPFSFVVDWFSTVGNVISAATDFLGIEVLNPIRSYKIQTFRRYQVEFNIPGFSPKKAGSFGNFHGINAGRSLGLVGPTLHMKPFKGFSTTRGATAVALLVQLLPKH